MILSYRDKATKRFAEGNFVKAFSGFARQVEMKLDRLDAAESLQDLAALPAIASKRSRVTDSDNTAFALMTNGEFVLSGKQGHRDPTPSKSSTITEAHMARTPIHPGEQLREELDTIGMSASELARQIKVPANRITEILNGSRAVSADTSLRLGHWFGMSPDFWLKLQMSYDLRLAQQTLGGTLASLPQRQAPTAA